MHAERYPDLVEGLLHVPNEGKRTIKQHAFLVAMGLRAGASDLLLLRARRGYHGLVMELKAPGKIATCTKEQKAFLRQMEKAGFLSLVCADPVVGWALLRWYIDETVKPDGPRFPPPNPHAIRWASQV